ncbi:MAG: ABC transporter permease [Chloroflexaceae bacterium]|nr:ABC transporter permease [Chloroflexaceae bacterium]
MSATSTTTPQPLALTAARPARKRMQTIMRFLRANPLVVIGLVIVLAWIVISLLAPLLAPYGPLQQRVVNRLKPPSAVNWFGTDQLGRDIFSRVLYGGRISLPAGLLVVLGAGVIGVLLGALAGMIGGWFDEIVMRVTEVFMAFPTIILAMAVAAALGPSLFNAVLAMVVVWWPTYARMMRGLVLSVKSELYVEAARVVGVPPWRILWRTVLPNCMAPLVVLGTIDLGSAILVFAGLSFLGLGSDPATPEWGRMVSDGVQFFDQWWVAAFPGLAICTLVIAFNFIGDGIRDALDPRLRKGL